MILPAQEIRRRGIFTPLRERTVQNGKSYGLSAAGYDVRIAEGFILRPGEFRLASTVEKFEMPDDVLGIVHDKSTWARQGLALQNTVVEPGWQGYLTLELTSHSSEPLTITARDPIAQIVLHQLLEPTEKPYTGKYQNQQSGPQGARFEEPRPAPRPDGF